MSNQLGPIDICCDAPPYPIVHACARLGFQTPADVRWCRRSHFPHEQGGWRGLLEHAPWGVFLGAGQPGENRCSCGQFLPRLEGYTFTLITGKEVSYLLGQCGGCRTMFWEDL